MVVLVSCERAARPTELNIKVELTVIAGTNTTKDGARFWGLIWTFGGSQLDHAFPETDGSEGSLTDTKASLFEFRRPPEKPPGHPRTRRRHGSGP